MSIHEYIGRRIRELRHSRGISLKVLSERCGLPQRDLLGIEDGTRPCPSAELARIAEAIGVNPIGLFRDESPAGEWDADNGSRPTN